MSVVSTSNRLLICVCRLVMLALVSVRWAWTLAMLAADLSDPAWTAARMLASEGSEGGSAAAAPGMSCLVGAGWRRGLVDAVRRGRLRHRVMASRFAKMRRCQCLGEGNEARNLSQNGYGSAGIVDFAIAPVNNPATECDNGGGVSLSAGFMDFATAPVNNPAMVMTTASGSEWTNVVNTLARAIGAYSKS